MLPVAHTTALYSAPQAKQYACNCHLNAVSLSLNSFAARHRRELITLAPSCMHLHWLTTLVLLTHQHRRRIDPILLQNPIHKRLNADCTQLHHSSTQTAHGFITAQRRLHTASSQLHHSSTQTAHGFITASSQLNADCTRLHHGFITAQRRLHTASSRLHHGFITATSSTPLTVMLNHPIPNHARRAWHGRHITRLLIRASSVFAHGSSIAIVAVPVTILSQL